MFRNDWIFKTRLCQGAFAFAQGSGGTRRQSGDGFTLRAARAEQRCQLRNRVLRPRDCARKNDAASELTRRRVSNY